MGLGPAGRGISEEDGIRADFLEDPDERRTFLPAALKLRGTRVGGCVSRPRTGHQPRASAPAPQLCPAGLEPPADGRRRPSNGRSQRDRAPRPVTPPAALSVLRVHLSASGQHVIGGVSKVTGVAVERVGVISSTRVGSLREQPVQTLDLRTIGYSQRRTLSTASLVAGSATSAVPTPTWRHRRPLGRTQDTDAVHGPVAGDDRAHPPRRCPIRPVAHHSPKRMCAAYHPWRARPGLSGLSRPVPRPARPRR